MEECTLLRKKNNSATAKDAPRTISSARSCIRYQNKKAVQQPQEAEPRKKTVAKDYFKPRSPRRGAPLIDAPRSGSHAGKTHTVELSADCQRTLQTYNWHTPRLLEQLHTPFSVAKYLKDNSTHSLVKKGFKKGSSEYRAVRKEATAIQKCSPMLFAVSSFIDKCLANIANELITVAREDHYDDFKEAEIRDDLDNMMISYIDDEINADIENGSDGDNFVAKAKHCVRKHLNTDPDAFIRTYFFEKMQADFYSIYPEMLRLFDEQKVAEAAREKAYAQAAGEIKIGTRGKRGKHGKDDTHTIWTKFLAKFDPLPDRETVDKFLPAQRREYIYALEHLENVPDFEKQVDLSPNNDRRPWRFASVKAKVNFVLKYAEMLEGGNKDEIIDQLRDEIYAKKERAKQSARLRREEKKEREEDAAGSV